MFSDRGTNEQSASIYNGMYSRANETKPTTYLHAEPEKKVAEDYVHDCSAFMMLRNKQNDIFLRDIFAYNKSIFFKARK